MNRYPISGNKPDLVQRLADAKRPDDIEFDEKEKETVESASMDQARKVNKKKRRKRNNEL